jgi:hypothetical protein
METENKKTAEAEQSAYEKAHGLVSRKDLRKRLLKQMDELDDSEFHEVYGLVWSLGAGKLLYKLAKEGEDRQRTEVIKLRQAYVKATKQCPECDSPNFTEGKETVCLNCGLFIKEASA